MIKRYYGAIPLDSDASAKFVPFIIGLMVYLATVALVMAVAINLTIRDWNTNFSEKLTIELPSTRNMDIAPDQHRQQVEKVLLITQQAPGIRAARTLEKRESEQMLKPWIGEGGILEDLPLPALIDVDIADRSLLNVETLAAQLQEIAPGAVIEDHLTWHSGILSLAHTIETVGFLVVMLIAFAAIATIAFTTQTSLIIHRSALEILHLVGAKNVYIARQFQHFSLHQGIKGGLIGFVLSALTFLVLRYFAQHIDLVFIPEFTASLGIWIIALLVPVAITLFMMLAARVTVLTYLKRITLTVL